MASEDGRQCLRVASSCLTNVCWVSATTARTARTVLCLLVVLVVVVLAAVYKTKVRTFIYG